jgi:hypothetical protein
MNPPPAVSPKARSGGQRIAILLLAIFQVAATLLPSLGIGEPIGERSDAVRTAITPAGWAFSIWGPLFAGSIIYALYQLAPSQRDNPLIAQIGWASAGAFLGNGVWAVYTQFTGLNPGSVLIIGFTLACLLYVYRSISNGRLHSRWDRFLVALPLSALAAWLTAATIVNVAASLSYHGVDAGDATPMVASAIVVVGGIIAATAVWRGRGNPWYALVFIWALAGIHSAAAGNDAWVSAATIAAALLVAAVAGARLASRPNRAHWFKRAL